ncbi:hypothetical protein MIMGU_mgv1a017101mg [Erythranthe guttata]|uniref:Uncharacterized protein n=1 Tax=Erythranthe guttata TaxID=4155 RepID=A0A022RYN5_ERYGU|nr:hypothetical protein MIMGU_mgv1a017101mg [Erythranthe guttata]
MIFKLNRNKEVVYRTNNLPVCKGNVNKEMAPPAKFSILLLIVESSNRSKTVSLICAHTNTIKNFTHRTKVLITKGTLQTCATQFEGQTMKKAK